MYSTNIPFIDVKIYWYITINFSVAIIIHYFF